jgi:DNA-directed RNA polymerase specialized sigma subunit
MTTRELKQLLDKSRILKSKYRLVCDKAACFRSTISYAKPVSYNNTGGKIEHNDNATERAYQILADYQHELDKLLHEWLTARDTTTSIIDTLDYEVEKEILTRRYINGENWDNIAGAVSYSVRQIHRIHGNALQKILLNSKDVIECHI